MRKAAIAFLLNCSHSHASIAKRNAASLLSFRPLATTQDTDVGALSEISMGASETRKAMEKRAPRLRKGKIPCSEQDLRRPEGSLHAEISAVQAETRANANIKSDAYAEGLDRVAATQLTDIGVVEAENVIAFDYAKADQNAALGKTEELDSCTQANANRSSVQEDLTEAIAKLNVNTYKCGSRWEETARRLLDYGIPLAHIIAMLKKCQKFSCSLHCVDSTLKHFALLGMSHQEMGSVISKWPTILSTTDRMLKCKVEFYESIGIDRCGLGKALTARVKVMMISLFVLKQNVAFWKDYMKDIHKNAVSIMIVNNPQLLTYRVQGSLQSKLAWLEGCDYDKKLLLKHSSILHKSLPLLISKAEVLERFGFSDARKRVWALSWVVGLKVSKLQARFNNLLAAGFSRDQVQNILSKSPAVLSLTEDHINSKLSYAVNVINASHDALVASPGFWSHSLETRIKYRYEVIKELQTLGALQRGLSLGYMVCMTKADFNRKFVEKFQDVVKHADTRNA